MGDPNKRNKNKIISYAVAGNVADRISTSVYILEYKYGTISWSSRKHSCVFLSLTEAEYIAIAEACQGNVIAKYVDRF